jgi:energy-coupling factor transporter ATP-binding protein EcfA2
MQLQLKRFDMSTISGDEIVVLVGRRGSGKSLLVKDIMHYQRSIPVGTVISPTEPANQYFSKFVPDVFIHEHYHAGLVENAVKRQEMVVRRMNRDKEMYGSSKIDPRMFLIMDDCLYDKTWVRDTVMRKVFMNGRHYRLLTIITQQYPLGIPPDLRQNVDIAFILRDNINKNRMRIYENYASMFPSFDVFCQVLDQTTENYECLVINNRIHSNRIEDQVFWYKADVHDAFRLGAPEFWAMKKDVDTAQEMQTLEDMNDYYTSGQHASALLCHRNKSKGPQICVRKKV